MVRMGSAAQEHAEPVRDVLGTHPTIRGKPVGLTLSRQGLENHIHGTIEIVKDLARRPVRRVGELPWPVSNIAGPCDLRSYVVAEIAGQMKQQVSDRIAVRKGSLPQLLGGKRLDEGVYPAPHAVVVCGQALGDQRR
jgi:hypothetical protein